MCQVCIVDLVQNLCIYRDSVAVTFFVRKDRIDMLPIGLQQIQVWKRLDWLLHTHTMPRFDQPAIYIFLVMSSSDAPCMLTAACHDSAI